MTLSAVDTGLPITFPGSSATLVATVSGQYEIVSSLTAPTTAPPNAVEAVARLWAYRETLLKPGDLSGNRPASSKSWLEA